VSSGCRREVLPTLFLPEGSAAGEADLEGRERGMIYIYDISVSFLLPRPKNSLWNSEKREE